MSIEQDKLKRLMRIEGWTNETAMLEAVVGDSLCPCICMNEGCDYTELLEGDQDEGWCEECNTGSMKSALILAGLI